MALEKSIKFKDQLDLPAAYHRVSYVGVDKDAGRVVFQVQVFADQASRKAKAAPLDSYSTTISNEPERTDPADPKKKIEADPKYDAFMASQAAGDTFAAAYDSLKVMPAFEGSKDV